MMSFLTTHILTLILFLPVLGALVLLFLPGTQVRLIRWLAFGLSLIPFALFLPAWAQFNPTITGFQFEENIPWYPAINSFYHLGIDGISLTMLLLTTLLTPLAILASFSITDRILSLIHISEPTRLGMISYAV